jgi:hypothetical protein
MPPGPRVEAKSAPASGIHSTPRGGPLGVQWFPQEIPNVARWKVRQLAKELVAEMLVEREGLEVVGIEVDGVAAAVDRLRFDLNHEVPAKALSPEFITQPEVRDEQPVPVSLTHNAADNAAVGVPDECCELPPIVRPSVLDVVVHQTFDDLLHVHWRRVIDYFDRRFVGHG